MQNSIKLAVFYAPSLGACGTVSRAVSLVIMRVRKPKVEYKLTLQEKPEGLTRPSRLKLSLLINLLRIASVMRAGKSPF